MASTEEIIDVAALIENQPANRLRNSIVIWGSAVMLLEGYDMQVLAYAAPSIIREWGVNKAYFGLVFSSGLFGYMLGALLLSSLADRFGRKTIIIGGALVFGAFNLAVVYATSLVGLLIFRLIGGLGLGASVPSTIALVVEYFPSRRRATMVGVVFVGYMLGATSGGFIAAKFIPTYGWHSLFYVGGIAPIALALTLLFTLPESVRFLTLMPQRRDRVIAILQRLRPDITFARDAKFVVREEIQSGVPVKHLFTGGRARTTLLLWVAYAASLLGDYFLTSWLPTVLISAGVSFAHAVIAGALLQAGGAVGGLALCWLLDRRGIIAIAFAYVLAAPFIVLIGSSHTSDVLLLLIVFVAGACLIGGQIGLNGISGTFYPTRIRSTGVGWALGVGRVGSIFGPVLGGMLISFNTPIPRFFFLAAVPALCCATALFLIRKSPASS